MYRFFVDPAQISETEVCITGPDVNHMKNALRMKAGEEIRVSDRAGMEYFCRISSLNEEEVRAEILLSEESGQELPIEVYLFQGLPKNEKMELIIQKTVELGMYEIIPVAAKRSIVKLDAKKVASKEKRWNAISESAAKQSKRGIIPKVTPVMTMKEAFDYAEQMDLVLMPYECEGGMARTRELFSQVKPGMKVGIFIGPEGGLDEKEVEEARARGFHPVTLGKRILRTETAGLMVMSVLMYLLEQE